jgi:hypothetical protein
MGDTSKGSCAILSLFAFFGSTMMDALRGLIRRGSRDVLDAPDPSDHSGGLGLVRALRRSRVPKTAQPGDPVKASHPTSFDS